MTTQTCRLGKRCFAILLCVAVACSFAGVIEAYAAGNVDKSPYSYSIKANGTTFTNDHRAKNNSSKVGVTPSTKDYYVSPNGYVPKTGKAYHAGTRTYVNWTAFEKGITNTINKKYSYAKLAFDAGGKGARTCKGKWRPDTTK